MSWSTRAPRRRQATGPRLAVAALLGAVLLGWPAPALADPAATVTFEGGCGVLGLGGGSTPDVAELTVPSGSEVAFRNDLTRPAVLRLDGGAVAEVAPGDTATVWFGAGVVTVTMEILCLVGQPTGAVTVSVAPATSSRSGDGSAQSAPAPRSPAAPSPAAGNGDAGTVARPADDRISGPPGEPGGVSPSPGVSSPAATADPGPEASATGVDGSAEDAERVTVDGSAEVVDPGFASRSLSGATPPAGEDGSIGLLALIATVCVVGVSAGAVRAMIAQRANRAEWA